MTGWSDLSCPTPAAADARGAGSASVERRRLPREAAEAPCARIEADGRLLVIGSDAEGVVRRLSLRAFRGVAMACVRDAEGGFVFRLELAHPDPSRSVLIAEVADAGEAAEVWERWAAASGLPLLVVDGDGSMRAPVSRLGTLYVLAPYARRWGRPTRNRRPGRAALRAVGTLTGAAVHAGEREIIART
ncbi:DUF6101 family protein [Segnochrobactraceae bacterium EtOH-i3]